MSANDNRLVMKLQSSDCEDDDNIRCVDADVRVKPVEDVISVTCHAAE